MNFLSKILFQVFEYIEAQPYPDQYNPCLHVTECRTSWKFMGSIYDYREERWEYIYFITEWTNRPKIYVGLTFSLKGFAHTLITSKIPPTAHHRFPGTLPPSHYSRHVTFSLFAEKIPRYCKISAKYSSIISLRIKEDKLLTEIILFVF